MAIAKIILSYILGYVRVTIEGYYIERFINICNTKKILMWNLKRDRGVKVYANIGIKDFRKLIEISKKTQCKVKITKKRGLPFILNRYRKRKMFAVLLIILILLIILSSNYIWNIEIQVEGEGEVIGIEQQIKEAGLVVGKKKTEIEAKEIINKIRLERADISWMGIEMKGTNVIVKLVKSEEAPQLIDENDYTNIVANKNGVITKITAQNGTAKVSVGDVVQKGMILIEGTMVGKYTEARYVHSIGEVEAKVWYTKSKKIYYNEEKEQKTGKEERKYRIKINNFEINFNKRLSKFKIYDKIEEEKKIKIFSNLYLPISIIKTTNQEKEIYKKTYTKEEAKNLGIEELRKELEEEIDNTENIVEEIINTKEEKEYIEVNLTYEVVENIGTDEKIEI